jgi:hypothetical protein
MQSKSRTCIDCSIIPLVIMSNSGHCFTADIISTLLFEDALSCFKGGSSSIQVAVYVLKSQLFGNVFSNLTVGPLYLFPWFPLPFPQVLGFVFGLMLLVTLFRHTMTLLTSSLSSIRRIPTFLPFRRKFSCGTNDCRTPLQIGSRH